MDSSGSRYSRPTTEVNVKKSIYACFCAYVHEVGGNNPDKEQTNIK